MDLQKANYMIDVAVAGYIFILLDFHRFIDDAAPDIERRLKTISQLESMISVVVTAPNYISTPALDNEFSLIDFPYPNKEEISIELDNIVDRVSNKQGKLPNLKKEVKESRETIIQAVNGLTCKEIQKAFSKSLVIHRKFDIPTILREKQQIIKKHEILEFYEPEVSIDDIGGLGEMVNWLLSRKDDFTQRARDFNMPFPKGLLVFGFSGVGKSLTAKATSSLFNLPLLRLDFGKLFQSYVGSSEAKVREALKLCETCSPSILWIDEVEKGLSGLKSSGQTDGGTTSRVVGTLLTWMQEKKFPVFMFCTANDHSQIPPEFMRRFDEVFFVDLPNIYERVQIYKVLLKKYNRDQEKYKLDLMTIANKSDGYSGSEIEKSINEAIHICFNDGMRDITTCDIIGSLESFKPLSKMKEAEFSDMRGWAEATCKFANSKSDGNYKINNNLKYENLDLSENR
jgi:SpoVK/Ycf46/Vps4 family AAA+-type ATPase